MDTNTDLKHLENEITVNMRTAIMHLDTDHFMVRKHLYRAHDLFGDHLMEWSEDFCTLYNQMLAGHRAHTPMPKGYYRTKNIAHGYCSFPVKIWVTEEEQPLIPTADELVVRFDRLISAYRSSEEAAYCWDYPPLRYEVPEYL